jgi:hypothetical protein
MSADIIHQDATMQLAAAGDLFVERWSGRGSPAQLRILNDLHGAFLRRRAPAKSLYLVHFFSPDLAMFDGEIRRLVQEHVQLMDEHTAAVALVYGTEGFGAAALRLAMSAAALVRRGKYPFRVFRDLDEALAWLGRQRDGAEPVLDAAALKSWYAQIGRQLSG